MRGPSRGGRVVGILSSLLTLVMPLVAPTLPPAPVAVGASLPAVRSEAALGDLTGHTAAQVGPIQSPAAPAPPAVPAGSTVVKKVAVIMFTFSDLTSMPWTADQVRHIVFTGNNSTKKFYTEVTNGAWELQGKNSTDGDVFGPYTIANSARERAPGGGCNYTAWGAAARAKAAAANVDLSGYDNIVFFMPQVAGCDFVGIADSIPGNYVWVNGPAPNGNDSQVVAHELGHNFGLRHANFMACRDSQGNPVTLSDLCTDSLYGDTYDTMGNAGLFHFSAFNKEKLGVLAAGNIQTASASGTFTLHPIERASTGLLSLKIPRGTNQRPLYLEYRQPYGFDNFDAVRTSGVFLRLGYDLNVPEKDRVTSILDATPSTTNNLADAALPVDGTFTDPVCAIQVRTTSTSATGATVQVTLPSGLAVSPNRVQVAVGGKADLDAQTSLAGQTRQVDLCSVWTSNSPTVAQVDRFGNVDALAPGTATITATYGAMTAAATVTVPCPAASSFDCASAIGVGDSVTGNVAFQQNNYYRFQATAGTTYTVTLTPNGGDSDLFAHAPDRTQAGRSENGSGSVDRVVFTATTAGAYYIRVYGYSVAGYTLALSAGSGTCTTGAGFDCAIALSASTTGSAGYQQSIYYRFYAAAGTSQTVTLSPTGGDADLYVYDPNGGQLGFSNSGASSVDQVTFTAVAAGYYYVRVYGFSGSTFTLSK